ncbi:MAG: hypothetical protein KJ710_00980 [Candidatus Omnitrophica bacterium]|nr:hypothetical protein [Candidatus Omnitrophota bacterium]MBU1922823.1 hypothetical protein [Candidatus Omnitrophota bacterium]
MGRDRWSRRYAVEDCRVVNITKLKQEGYLEGISVVQSEILLQYSREIMVSEYEEYDYPIKLESTPCFFGGRRWWFICTKNPDGVYCGNRVGRLYLPPNARYYSCRHCHNLTYTSCRKSHDLDSIYRLMTRFGVYKNRYK